MAKRTARQSTNASSPSRGPIPQRDAMRRSRRTTSSYLGRAAPSILADAAARTGRHRGRDHRRL